jgi:sigma-B regulation protein RsbU (phosphoserine phosphatase)
MISGTKPRLLVVDDEPANLQKLKRTFLSDFEVSQAGSGEEALQLLKSQAFQVIITDQRMPGLSGVELLRESLALSPRALRIILTGYSEAEDLMGAINEGQVNRYILKPWEPYSLRTTVLQDLELQRLREENAAITEQLRIAAEVQKHLFPQVKPDIHDLDYYAVCHPAAVVGGDYFDYLELWPGRLSVSVGDISGKGISAALLMANLQGLLRSSAPVHGDHVDQLAHVLNRSMCERNSGHRFASLFYGIFDSSTRRLIYFNAGHCPPFLVRNGEVRRLNPTGPLLGAFEASAYQRASVDLAPDDLLVIFTDGLAEAERTDLTQFGEDRMENLVLEGRMLPIEQLADRIFQEVAAHCGEAAQQDDQTLLIARVGPQSLSR